MTPLGERGTVVRGVTYKKHQAVDQPRAGYVQLLRATNIDGTRGGRLSGDDSLYVPEELVREDQRLRAGDLVLSASSGSLSAVGKCAPVTTDFVGATFGAFCAVLRPADTDEAPFLRWVLQGPSFRDYVTQVAAGTNINNLKPGDLAAFPVPAWRLSAQRTVVAAIDDAFARIDAVESELVAVGTSARHLMLAASREALGLGRSDGEHQLVPLSALVTNLDKQRVPVNRKERDARPGEIPYYGATGQVGWIDAPLFDEDLVLLGEDGVAFLDPWSTKAYRVSGPSWVNNHAHVLRPDRTKVNDRYLCLALNHIDYSGFVNGTTRLKLTQGQMNQLPIPTPGIEAQLEAVGMVEAVESIVGRVHEEVDSVRVQLQALRASVLYRALSGQLPGVNFMPTASAA